MKTINHRWLWLFISALLVCVLALSLVIGIEANSQTKLGTIPEFCPELELGALQGYLDPQGATEQPRPDSSASCS